MCCYNIQTFKMKSNENNFERERERESANNLKMYVCIENAYALMCIILHFISLKEKKKSHLIINIYSVSYRSLK